MRFGSESTLFWGVRSMSFEVFYAFQADRPAHLCRDFIRNALNSAVEILEHRPGLEEIVVLEGSAGIPGAPSIPDEIVNRIEHCGVFVADLTVVTSYSCGAGGRNKLSSNGNVLLETGIASGTGKKWGRIIFVANEAFGPVESLIFDVRHREVKALYKLQDSSPNREEEQKKLCDTFVKEIALVHRESVRDQTVKDLAEILDVIPTDAIPRDGGWHGPKIAEVNVRLAQGIIGRRAELDVVISYVDQPRTGRYVDMIRLSVLTPADSKRHFAIVMYCYFGDLALLMLQKKRGHRVKVGGVISRADVSKKEEPLGATEMNIDIHECQLIGED
jgi:hypothetical protein